MTMKTDHNLLPSLGLFLFITLLASWAIVQSQQPPNALLASSPSAEFSAERAFRHVEALARMPLAWWFLPRDKTDMMFVTKTFAFSGKSGMKVN
jgi:hypothetical protein